MRSRPRHDPLIRAAAEIEGQLFVADRRSDNFTWHVESLLTAQRQVEQTARRLHTARRRGLELAAGRLAEHLRDQVLALQRLVVHLSENHPVVRRQPPGLAEILSDLRQLQAEFEQVEVKGRVITVTTDAITLQNLYLGPFAIELPLERLSRRADCSAFRCVALDPQPASTAADTTHPHVRDRQLCAGEATAAIAVALREGRIADAFCLVSAVLHTYNPHSPYVAIDEWDGMQCGNCDATVDRDDLYFCDACQGDYCEQCTASCDLCDVTACRGCLERDPISRRRCCSECRHTCGRCSRTVDADSFDTNSQLCPECHEAQRAHSDQTEAQEGEEHEHERSTPTATTSTSGVAG